jgi:hypothetical protein
MRPGIWCTDKGRFGRSPHVANGAIYGVRAHGVKLWRAETGCAGEIRGQAGIRGPGLRRRFIRAIGPGIQKPDLSRRINVIWPVQPACKNISSFPNYLLAADPNHFYISEILSHSEGRCATSTARDGERWTLTRCLDEQC